MPLSATDTVNLAFEHTKRQLFQPFRFWQWTRLALVGLLAGEASGGGFNATRSFGSHGGGGSLPQLPNIDFALLGAFVAVLVLGALVFAVVMTYVSCVMRFILFDSVVARECHIRQGWMRRQKPGMKLFLWQAGFGLAMLVSLIVLVGIPAGIAYSAGWFKAPREHLAPLIVGGILLFFVMAALLIAAAVVQVLTKDFVVPQMALEGIGAVEGWRRLWRMMEVEKSGFAAYIGLKILLSIGIGILIGIASLIVVLIIVIPTAGVAIAAIFAGKAAGLTWDVFTITAAVVAACVVLSVLFYLSALIAVPAIVFFPAYSIYFFAARYRPLSLVLYPAPAQAAPSALGIGTGSPPPEPFPAG